MLRIGKDSMTDGSNRSTNLRKELKQLESNEVFLKKTIYFLKILLNYCSDSVNITGTHAVKRLEEDNRKVFEEKESLKSLTTKLIDFEKRGLTAKRLKELMGYLDITDVISSELDVLVGNLQIESKKITNEINSKKIGRNDANNKIMVLAEKSGLSKSSSASILSKTIASEIKRCNQKNDAAVQLSCFIDMKEGLSIIELSHRIKEVREMTLKLITVRKQEEEKGSRFNQLELQIKTNKESLTEQQSTFDNMKKALNTLGNLLCGENSLENIKLKLLKDNTAVISEIFSKIHLPNEYDISFGKSEIKLIDKESGESRSLKQVSTGQRAAFALSLFLTMNKTLENGPKVILLDDPISHIDDVNMLSFLDYLRELAIEGNRQIFFATPNTKLASLFRHKFKFLGEGEFKEIRMTR